MPRTKSIHSAETAAAALPPLLVEAERVAASVAQGVHGRKKTGQGDTFWQFRPYQQGESTRRIDWRQSAKTQHHFVREHEWEIAQTVWLWRDPSASMHYSSNRKLATKIHRSEVLTLALSSLLIRAGEQIALLGEAMPPSSTRATLHRMARLFEDKPTDDSLISLPSHEHLPRHAELVLIGDFLSPLNDMEEALKRYSRRHVRGHLVQVLDPAEESLPFEGRVRFDGLEKEGSIYFGNVGAIREAYRDRLSSRRLALSALAHSLGWSFHCHTTDQSATSALLALYQAITQGKS